jgi:hypothetical protein
LSPGWEVMAPAQPSTDWAVSASSRKTTAGSGGAQARIRWASITALSWARLGARRLPATPRLSVGVAAESGARLT